MRNEEKKFHDVKKHTEIATAVSHLFYITFSETSLINMKFGNWHWAFKIIERNNERNFFVKTPYQKIFRSRYRS